MGVSLLLSSCGAAEFDGQGHRVVAFVRAR
jgi:hypothetical protein